MENMYFRVAVTDGWIVDTHGRYLRDVIAYDCGHNHKSEEAAQKCREKLTKQYPDGSTSARWYNSKVLRVDSDGRHAPPTRDEIGPGWCVRCGADVAGATADQTAICKPCGDAVLAQEARR